MNVRHQFFLISIPVWNYDCKDKSNGGFLLLGVTGRAGKTETIWRYAEGYRVQIFYDDS